MSTVFIPVIKRNGAYIVFTSKWDGVAIAASNLADLQKKITTAENYWQCETAAVAVMRARDAIHMAKYPTGSAHSIKVKA